MVDLIIGCSDRLIMDFEDIGRYGKRHFSSSNFKELSFVSNRTVVINLAHISSRLIPRATSDPRFTYRAHPPG